MDKYTKIDATVMWNVIRCSQNFYTSQVLTAVQIEQTMYDDAEFRFEDGSSAASYTGGQ